jgi:hypothetical protein
MLCQEGWMSANRLHAGLLEAAARELDRNLRALTPGETFRAENLRDYAGQLEFLGSVIDTGVEIRGRFTWAKALLKRLLRPYLIRQARVDRMIVDRLFDLTEAVKQSGSALEGLREEMRDDLEYQENRLRTAVLRGRRRIEGVSAGSLAKSLRVADTAEAFEIPEGARLFLGDTPVPRPGYLRVAPHDAEADVSAPLDAIPARAGSIAEVVAANVLEDYSAAEVRHILLPHWGALLRPGGWLTLIADDFGAAADRLRDGQIDAESFAEALFGDGGRARRSAFTPEALRCLAEEAGLVHVRVSERAQRPDAGVYGFELTAAAPAA